MKCALSHTYPGMQPCTHTLTYAALMRSRPIRQDETYPIQTLRQAAQEGDVLRWEGCRFGPWRLPHEAEPAAPCSHVAVLERKRKRFPAQRTHAQAVDTRCRWYCPVEPAPRSRWMTIQRAQKQEFGQFTNKFVVRCVAAQHKNAKI